MAMALSFSLHFMILYVDVFNVSINQYWPTVNRLPFAFKAAPVTGCVQHLRTVPGPVDRGAEVLSARAAGGRGPQVRGQELHRW